MPQRTTAQRASPRRQKPPTAVAIFARLPVPGRAKTRLSPLLGPVGAAQFQTALIADVTLKVDTLASRPNVVAPYFFIAEPLDSAAGVSFEYARTRGCPRWTILEQRGADLGARLDHAFRTLLRQHASVVVMGTDSPLLPRRILRAALSELRVCDAVLGPCPDGGYYLVGLCGRARAALGRRGLFDRVRWGTAFALRDTLRNLGARDLSCSILEPVDDVDRPDDVQRLRRELARNAAARRLAPATWRFLKR